MGRHILVVDDEPSIRLLMREVLEGAGYTIEEASNGEEAIRRISRQKPDLVLLDLCMPVKSGSQVVEELRAQPSTAHLPLTIVSGSTSVLEFPDMSLVDGYLVKPFDLNELLYLVRRLMERREKDAKTATV